MQPQTWLKSCNSFVATIVRLRDRNRTVQKINAYKKALNNLKPTAREQQLIDSGVVSAYDRAMNYKLALDKERAEFEGN